MKKNLSFILDGVNVYTDICLVRDEIPIFFTCIDDEGRFYLALCIDMDTPEYCVVRVKTSQLNNMLLGRISMKKIFTLQKKCWRVTPVDDDIENDKVLLKNTADLDEDELPDDGAYFELFNDELKVYAETISKKMLEGEFVSTDMDTDKLKDIHEERLTVSIGISGKLVSAEICDTTEIPKSMIIQDGVLTKYNKEDGCTIAQADYSVENQKSITITILVEKSKDDSSLTAA